MFYLKEVLALMFIMGVSFIQYAALAACPDQIRDYEVEGFMFGYNEQSALYKDDGTFYRFTNLSGEFAIDGHSIESNVERPMIKKMNADFEVEVLRFLGDEEITGTLYSVSESPNGTFDVLIGQREPFSSFEGTGLSSDKENTLILVSLDQDLQVLDAAVVGYGEGNGNSFHYNALVDHDQEGNVLIYGAYMGKVFLGGQEADTINNPGSLYLASFTDDFSPRWVNFFGSGNFDDSPGDILTDQATGEIFIGYSFTGTFRYGEDSISYDGFGHDIGVSKVNNDGEFLWTFHQPSTGVDMFNRLHIGPEDNLYVSFRGNGGFQMDNDTVFVTEGNRYPVLFQLDPEDGSMGWTRYFPLVDMGDIYEFHNLPGDEIMAIGWFRDSIEIGDQLYKYNGIMDENIPNQANGFFVVLSPSGSIQRSMQIESDLSVSFGSAKMASGDCFYSEGTYRANAAFFDFNLSRSDSSRRYFNFKTDMSRITNSLSDHLGKDRTLAKLWPNPTEGQAYFNLDLYTGDAGKLRIYSPDGRLQKALEIKESLTVLDLTGFQSGMFYWHYEGSSGRSQNGRLLIE